MNVNWEHDNKCRGVFLTPTMSKPAPLQPDGYYHIFNRGVDRCDLFREPRNYAHFLKLYTQHIDPIAETFAFCLMRNHFHLFVRIKPITLDREFPDVVQPAPSQSFSNLFNAYTKVVNHAFSRTGSLFEHPFHRIAVTSDAYFTRLITYIHLNPHKHGFVDDFRDWPYSSYDAVLATKPTRIQREAVLNWFEGTDRFAAARTDYAEVWDTPGLSDDE